MTVEQDGEDAIADAIERAYPGAQVIRAGSPREGRFRQLAGCFAVRLETPAPHWLVVSRGFTELGDKESEDADVSGLGFELTCRVPAASQNMDFGWVVDWMQGIADQLEENGLFLEQFHTMPMVDPSHEDEACALVFVPDASLAPTVSANGHFAFLQMVGLTAGELAAIRSWQAAPMVELMRQRSGDLVFDPKRKSYLREPEFASQVNEGRSRDGSSMGMITGAHVMWFEQNGLEIHLAEREVSAFKDAVRYRLRFGRNMLIAGDTRPSGNPDGSGDFLAQTIVVLLPEEGRSEVEEKQDIRAAVLRVGSRAGEELLESLEERPGTYVLSALAGVRFVVASNERFADPRYPW